MLVSKQSKRLFSRIENYERGKLTRAEEVLLFAELLESGMVWRLKGKSGHYGARAMELIKEGALEEPLAQKVLGNHDWRASQDLDVSEE